MRILNLLLMTIVVAFVSIGWGAAFAASPAQQGSPPEPARKAVVDEIVAVIRVSFAFPEKRGAVIDRLLQSLASGRYDADDHTFAARVSEDLLAVTGDKHMYLVDDPAGQIALSASPKQTDETIAAPNGVWAARFKRENYGLVEQKILDGNVRYLDITAFDWTKGVTADAYDDAIRFLRDGDAIIIDLRRNPGGTPEAVRYLLSHFVNPDELLATFYEGNKTKQLRALREVPAGRIIGKPLYVLISGSTASAAEEFAYYIANHRLGEIVGEKSAGAGNVKSDFPISPGFVLSVSVARSVDPFTHSNWEGMGISPTIRSPVRSALSVAHVHALEHLSATSDVSAKRALALDIRRARSRVNPVQLSPQVLAAYAGSYGERRIWVAEDGLRWKRGEQAELAMEPLGDDWFDLGETGSQAHFQMANGRATAVAVSSANGDGAPTEKQPEKGAEKGSG